MLRSVAEYVVDCRHFFTWSANDFAQQSQCHTVLSNCMLSKGLEFVQGRSDTFLVAMASKRFCDHELE